MQEPAIIFEDNHIIVAIKPQNVGCCPDASGDDNLLDQLKKHKDGFVGLVHRLDRVTGGVMVFAKTSKSASRLSEQIKEHLFDKTYLAVTNGTPKNREGVLVNHLKKNETKNIVEVVPPATTGAKRAELSYAVSTKTPITQKGIALVEVKLVTGRSHQIRAQLAHIGCPIVGDVKYGASPEKATPALWAHKLSFVHPVTEDKMSFVVNPPETAPWTHFDFDRQSHKRRDA